MRRPCKLSIYLTPRRPHFVPQPVLLDKAAIKSKPVTYAESCGAKLVPPKRSSVKATSLTAL